MSTPHAVDGPSCPGCGLPNYFGLCPVCRGDEPAYEQELAAAFGPWYSEHSGQSPCFMMCGKAICRRHGCLLVYEAECEEAERCTCPEAGRDPSCRQHGSGDATNA